MNLSLHSHLVDKLIELSLEEDIGRGDISCIAIESCLKNSMFEFKAKEDFILCGIDIAKGCLRELMKILRSTLIKRWRFAHRR